MYMRACCLQTRAAAAASTTELLLRQLHTSAQLLYAITLHYYHCTILVPLLRQAGYNIQLQRTLYNTL
jgi:hypothetical protein